jgi:hypothetical protein
MMVVATLGDLNVESFCESVVSSVKLVVSDLHVSLKPSEIWMLVMLRMNHGFMEYMRKLTQTHPCRNSRTHAYVRTHGLDTLVDDEEQEKDDEV